MVRTRLRMNETGASAVEYGLIVAAIAAVIAVILFGLGQVVNDTYKKSCDELANARSTTC